MQTELQPMWRELTAHVRELCAQYGFDLVHPFRLEWYNAAITDPELRLDDLGRPGALALVIGNSGQLWPVFQAALASDPELCSEPNPLDCYTTKTLHAIAASLPVRALVRFSHTLDPSPIPIQRVAHAAGFARLSPSHLSIHPQHGPWIGLRAVLVVDLDGPEGDAPEVWDPCCDCARPCVPALNTAISRTREQLAMDPLRTDWRAWLDVRDACPQGRTSRYSDEQVEYHYTKLRSLLNRAS